MVDNILDAPGYVQCFCDILEGFSSYLKLATYSNGDGFIDKFNFPLLISDFVDDLSQYFKVTLQEITLSVFLALFFTLTRYFLTIWIIKVRFKIYNLSYYFIAK